MRIAVIIESFPALSETFISNKAKFLCERGHEVFVFCNSKNNELFKKIFGKISAVKVIPFNLFNFTIFLLLHPWHLWKSKTTVLFKKHLFDEYRLYTINRYHCDILHFEFSGVAISYLHNLDRLNGKKVVSCRGTAENVNLVLYGHRQQSIRRLFEKVHAIHCVSEAMRRLILPYCSESSKIFINRPGVDTSLFERDDRLQREKVPIILSIGRLTFQKGYLVGLLAIRKLKETYTGFKWIIVGNGIQREEMVFLIHKMNLEHHVFLSGKKNVDEVIELYNNASVVFLPSVYEGIANVVLEAMSMNVPVVATRCGGIEEVITHGVNGLLADVYAHDQLAENLLQLLRNRELRETIARAGRKTVTRNFDSSAQITRFEQAYSQLLTTAKRAPVLSSTFT